MWGLPLKGPCRELSSRDVHNRATARLTPGTPRGVAAVSIPPLQSYPQHNPTTPTAGAAATSSQDTVRPRPPSQPQILSSSQLVQYGDSSPVAGAKQTAGSKASSSELDESGSCTAPNYQDDPSWDFDEEQSTEPPLPGLETKQHIRPYLTRCVCNCQTFAELHGLISAYMERFDHILVAASFCKLAKLVPPLPPGVGGVGPIRQQGGQLTITKQQNDLLQVLHKLTERLHLVLPLYWSAREVANCMWAMGKLQYSPDARVLAAMIQHLEDPERQRLKLSNPQELSMLVYGLAKLSYKQPSKVWYLVSQLSQRQLKGFKPQEISVLVWAYATVRQRDTPLFATMADEAVRGLGGFTPQGLSMLSWAFATMNHHDSRMFCRLADEFMQQITTAGPQSIAITAWAFARVYHHHPVLFEKLSRAATAILPMFGTQEMSILLWALARAEHKDEELMAAAAQFAILRMRYFRTDQLCWVLWSFARLRIVPPPEFVAPACGSMQHLLPSCTSQHLALVANALARMPGPDQGMLLAALGKHAQAKVDEFTPQGLSLVARGLAHRGHQDLELFAVLVRAAKQQLDRFKPIEVANLLWAVSRVGRSDPSLFAAAAPLVMAGARARRFPPASIVQVAWAYAAQGHYDEPLFNLLARLSSQNVPELAPGQLGHLLWALSHIGHSYPPVYEAAAKKLLGKLPTTRMRTLVTVTVAFSKAQYRNTELYEALTRELLARRRYLQAGDLSRLAEALASIDHAGLAELLCPRTAADEMEESSEWQEFLGNGDVGALEFSADALGLTLGSSRQLGEVFRENGGDVSGSGRGLRTAELGFEPSNESELGLGSSSSSLGNVDEDSSRRNSNYYASSRQQSKQQAAATPRDDVAEENRLRGLGSGYQVNAAASDGDEVRTARVFRPPRQIHAKRPWPSSDGEATNGIDARRARGAGLAESERLRQNSSGEVGYSSLQSSGMEPGSSGLQGEVLPAASASLDIAASTSRIDLPSSRGRSTSLQRGLSSSGSSNSGQEGEDSQQLGGGSLSTRASITSSTSALSFCWDNMPRAQLLTSTGRDRGTSSRAAEAAQPARWPARDAMRLDGMQVLPGLVVRQLVRHRAMQGSISVV